MQKISGIGPLGLTKNIFLDGPSYHYLLKLLLPITSLWHTVIINPSYQRLPLLLRLRSALPQGLQSPLRSLLEHKTCSYGSHERSHGLLVGPIQIYLDWFSVWTDSGLFIWHHSRPVRASGRTSPAIGSIDSKRKDRKKDEEDSEWRTEEDSEEDNEKDNEENKAEKVE